MHRLAATGCFAGRARFAGLLKLTLSSLLLALALMSSARAMTTLPTPGITVYLSATATPSTGATGWETGSCSSSTPCNPSALAIWTVPTSTVCQFIIPLGIYSSTLRVALKEDSQVIFSGASTSAVISSLSIALTPNGNIDPLNTTRRAYFDQMSYSASTSTFLSATSLTSVEIRNSTITSLNYFTMDSLISLNLIGSTFSVTGAAAAVSYRLPSYVSTGNISITDTTFSCIAVSPSSCPTALTLMGQTALSGPSAGRTPSIDILLDSVTVELGFNQISTLSLTNSSSSLPAVDIVIQGNSVLSVSGVSSKPIFELSAMESSPPGIFSSFKTSATTTIVSRSAFRPTLVTKNATANFELVGLSATNVTFYTYSRYPNTLQVSSTIFLNSLVSFGPSSTAYVSSSFFTASSSATGLDSVFFSASKTLYCNSVTFSDTGSGMSAPNLLLLNGSVVSGFGSTTVIRLGVCDGGSFAGLLKARNITGYTAQYDDEGYPSGYTATSTDVTLSYNAAIDNAFWTLQENAFIKHVSIRNLPALQIERRTLSAALATISTNSLAPFVGPVFPKVSVSWVIPTFKPTESSSPSVIMVSETVPFSPKPILDSSRTSLSFPIHLDFYDDPHLAVAYVVGEEEVSNSTLTCPLPKPSPESLFECSGALWVTSAQVNSTANVVVSSPIVVNANFEPKAIEITGLESTIEVLGCALLPSEITVILTIDDFKSLKVNGTRYAELIKSECYTAIPTNLTLIVDTNAQFRPCEKLSGSLSTSGQTITGLFVLNSASCNASSKTWWIVLAAVLGSVVLIAIILALVFSLIPSARLLVRPYVARTDYQKESNGNLKGS